jgi:hypothetical protein
MGPDFVKSLKGLADGAALLLVGLEADGVVHAHAEELQLDNVIDTLLRKLMAAGHTVTDAKLNSSIDGMLQSDSFAKLALGAKGDIVSGAQVDALGISDLDVNKYWEQIQKDVTLGGTVMNATRAGMPTSVAVPAPEFHSVHYIPRRPRGTAPMEEERDPDEYHDDEDPGYRIREIYEVELLAELSTKMSSPARAAGAGDWEGAPPVAHELAADGGGTGSRVAWEAREKTLAPAAGARQQVQATSEHGAQAGEAQWLKKNVKYAASGDPFYPVELDGVV